jgi:hypothetical protein
MTLILVGALQKVRFYECSEGVVYTALTTNAQAYIEHIIERVAILATFATRYPRPQTSCKSLMDKCGCHELFVKWSRAVLVRKLHSI